MNRKLYLPMAFALVAMSSCMDKAYDLTNIDRKAQVPVSDFTIPLKQATVELDDALDISDASKIKKDNGKYYVLETGDITGSSSISVPTFSASGKQQVQEGGVTLNWENIVVSNSSRKRVAVPANFKLTGEIESKTVEYTASATNVSKYVVDVNRIGVDANMEVNVKVEGLANYLKSMHINGLYIDFVKGLDLEIEGGTYDKETGVITVGDVDVVAPDFSYVLKMKLKGIEVGEGLAATFDAEKRKFDFAVKASVRQGATITAGVDDVVDNITSYSFPENAKYKITSKIDNVTATNFSGEVTYQISGIQPKTISLGDIPQMLKDSGTDIQLTNPHIKINVENPLVKNGQNVTATTGIRIKGNTTIETGESDITLDDAENKIHLAVVDDKIYEGYEFMVFPELKNVLSGKGVPSTLTVEVINPTVPVQAVEEFPLGVNYGPVTGNWEFYTPLQLTENSKINYTKTFDSNNDNFKELTVTGAVIDAEVDSDVPLDLNFTVSVNSNNRSMSGKLNGSAVLLSGQKNISITLGGSKVSDINGITVTAKIAGKDGVLSPTQKIILKNIKLKVNGYYEKEL